MLYSIASFSIVLVSTVSYFLFLNSTTHVSHYSISSSCTFCMYCITSLTCCLLYLFLLQYLILLYSTLRYLSTVIFIFQLPHTKFYQYTHVLIRPQSSFSPKCKNPSTLHKVVLQTCTNSGESRPLEMRPGARILTAFSTSHACSMRAFLHVFLSASCVLRSCFSLRSLMAAWTSHEVSSKAYIQSSVLTSLDSTFRMSRTSSLRSPSSPNS